VSVGSVKSDIIILSMNIIIPLSTFMAGLVLVNMDMSDVDILQKQRIIK
jgi:hypothetical protein